MFRQGEQVLLSFGGKRAVPYCRAVFIQEIPDGLVHSGGTEDTCVVRVNKTEIIVLKASVSPLLH